MQRRSRTQGILKLSGKNTSTYKFQGEKWIDFSRKLFNYFYNYIDEISTHKRPFNHWKTFFTSSIPLL